MTDNHPTCNHPNSDLDEFYLCVICYYEMERLAKLGAHAQHCASCAEEGVHYCSWWREQQKPTSKDTITDFHITESAHYE